MTRTLGTQLRHLIELLDGAVARSYETFELNYRPRYTPVMRVLIALESCTIGEIAVAAKVTQPAATQTVAMMLKDGIVKSEPGAQDARQRLISLTERGRAMVPMLQQCWKATAHAAQSIEDEMPYSFTATLEMAIELLEQRSFDVRIQEAHAKLAAQKTKKKTKAAVKTVQKR